MLYFNTSDQRELEGYISHIPSQPGHYNDIALSTGHYNDIARQGSSLVCPLICILMHQKTSILYIVDLISFTSGIEYFTFEQSFKSFISGLIIVLNCCYSVITHYCKL